MVKLIALPLISVFFLFSCGNPAADKDKSDTGTSKHSVTVSNPLDKTPHKDLDSLYTGTRIQKYDNGVIYMRGDVQGGLRVGEWMSFYRDGKVWSKGNYENGFRTGYGVSYYESGQKSSEGYYKDDAMVGLWKFWDEYGNEQDKDFGGK